MVECAIPQATRQQTRPGSLARRRVAVAAGDRIGDGGIDVQFLIAAARELLVSAGRAAPCSDIQARNMAPMFDDAIDVSLERLGATAAGEIFRATFLSIDSGVPAAEVTVVQPVEAETARAAKTPPDTAPVADDPAAMPDDPRWRRIFEAACEVIDRRGYGAASMREIARAAGLPIATLYQHIGAKEDLLFMITKGCMDQLFRTFRDGLGENARAETGLADAINAYIDYIERNRRYINLVYRETRSLKPENRARIFAIERAFAKRWQTLLDDGVARGVLNCANTELTAHALYFLCTLWALRHWAVDHFDTDEVKKALRTLALEGLRPRGNSA